MENMQGIHKRGGFENILCNNKHMHIHHTQHNSAAVLFALMVNVSLMVAKLNILLPVV